MGDGAQQCALGDALVNHGCPTEHLCINGLCCKPQPLEDLGECSDGECNPSCADGEWCIGNECIKKTDLWSTNHCNE